jgi:hypothetical protein
MTTQLLFSDSNTAGRFIEISAVNSKMIRSEFSVIPTPRRRREPLRERAGWTQLAEAIGETTKVEQLAIPGLYGVVPYQASLDPQRYWWSS